MALLSNIALQVPTRPVTTGSRRRGLQIALRSSLRVLHRLRRKRMSRSSDTVSVPLIDGAHVGPAKPSGDSTSVSSTVCRSKVERLMTFSTSAVAVCC